MCVYTTWVNFKLLYMATIFFFGERGNSLKVNKTQSTKGSIQICIYKKKGSIQRPISGTAEVRGS